MTLYCTASNCSLHRLCESYKPNDGGDQTVFTNHKNNTSRSDKCMSWVCHFFSPRRAWLKRDKNTICSPNTFRTMKGGKFIEPRDVK
jgi:hypothetical protein